LVTNCKPCRGGKRRRKHANGEDQITRHHCARKNPTGNRSGWTA